MKTKLKMEGTQAGQLTEQKGEQTITSPVLIVNFSAVLTREQFNSLKLDKEWGVDVTINTN